MAATVVTALKLVSFNVERDRKQAVLYSELMRLDETHNPAAFTLQETSIYDAALAKFSKEAGFTSYHGTGSGADESVTLVRNAHTVTSPRFEALGDGWWTVRGGHAPARWFTKVLIDGWLALGNVHLPPLGQHSPARFKAGPIGRLDDYGQLIDRARIFLNVPSHSRVVVGDWNITRGGVERMTPGWLAGKTHSRIYGQGIDYALAKRCHVSITTDRKTPEGSDHEPIVLVVKRQAAGGQA